MATNRAALCGLLLAGALGACSTGTFPGGISYEQFSSDFDLTLLQDEGPRKTYAFAGPHGSQCMVTFERGRAYNHPRCADDNQEIMRALSQATRGVSPPDQ